MADDWDLFAVVRSCTNTNKSSSSNDDEDDSNKTNNLNLDDNIENETWPKIEEHDENPLACLASLIFEQENEAFGFPNLLETGNIKDPFEELGQFYRPFYNPSPPAPAPPLLADVGVDLAPNTPSPTMMNPPNPHLDRPFVAGVNGGNNSNSITAPHFNPPNMAALAPPPPPPQQYNAHAVPPLPFHPPLRTRRRKSQQKKTVCLVTAENLSADMWAWRKYGQKPIKGSPYPRNYYRCSSSKGCSAKRQVERSTMELNMFTVSYTGEHNHPRPTHRSSLAGSTRAKFTPFIAPKPQNDGAAYFPAQTFSPTTPLLAAPVVLAAHEDAINDPMDIDDNMDIDEKPGSGSEEFAAREDNKNRKDGNGDDDDDNLLIPNSMAMNNEDIFLSFQGLGEGFGPSPPSSSSDDTFPGSH